MKFLLNNSLATANTAKDTSAFSFENPVKKNLVYSSKEKVLKIEIYSVDGRLIKTIKENNSTVSDLSKGVYVAKVSFENGKIISRKLIKD
nr:T9SS type A sorting domain-containing protein [Chryseobacterium lathyri]